MRSVRQEEKDTQMAWDTGLLGVARKIAGTDDSPLRVMAGPGTGKSFALKRRVARLLEEGANAERILAVTFTRNAAADLLEDLQALGVDGCERIRVGTLHAFCYSILMKREVLDILNRYPRPILFFNRSGIMQFEGSPLLTDTLRETGYGGKRDGTKAVRAFEAAWARLQSEEPGWALGGDDQAFHEALLRWLAFHEAILIGELVPLALQYLRDNPACPERQAFDHVLVDEFQDLNKAEQVLVDILGQNCNQFVVGDADQSIYGFRYAHPEGIAEFSATHPGTHDETLAECRRCPTRVVELAAHLIRTNYSAGAPARLNAFAGNPDGQVAIIQWLDLAAEAQGIADFCYHLVHQRDYTPADILILCPRRLIGYGIRDALRNADIPAHSFYYEEALEPVEAQRSFALLSLLCNNDDRVSLRFWLGLGSNTWNARGYSNLRNHCEASGESPFHAMEELAAGNLALPYTGRLVERFAILIEELAALSELRGYALLDRLYPAEHGWSGPVREAVNLQIADNTEPSVLLDLVRTQVTQPEKPDEGDFAKIMSLHKSKGLTSRVVVVVGCVEGLCPVRGDENLPVDEQRRSLEEQRRLFYVATTRCRDILILSSVTALEKSIAYKIGAIVAGGGTVGRTVTSRFIGELGPTRPEPVAGTEWVANGFE
jgi:superfamily I DNA/RNA helicase